MNFWTRVAFVGGILFLMGLIVAEILIGKPLSGWSKFIVEVSDDKAPISSVSEITTVSHIDCRKMEQSGSFGKEEYLCRKF